MYGPVEGKGQVEAMEVYRGGRQRPRRSRGTDGGGKKVWWKGWPRFLKMALTLGKDGKILRAVL